MDTSTDANYLYFGARRTCLEMLRDRGYNVPQQLFNLTEKEYGLTNKNTEIGGITDQQGSPVYIKLFDGAKKTALLESIKSLIGRDGEIELKELEGLRLFLIVDIKNNDMNKLYKEFAEHPFIEVFDVHHIFINPTKHIYQPKWRLMTKEEVTLMLQRYEGGSTSVSPVVLGSVCIDDPMNRYYGGRPPSKGRFGDIYEITRDGVNIFYRKVIMKKMNIGGDKK